MADRSWNDLRRLSVWGSILELLLVGLGGLAGAVLGVGLHVINEKWNYDFIAAGPFFPLVLVVYLFIAVMAGVIAGTAATMAACERWVTPVLKRSRFFSCERRGGGSRTPWPTSDTSPIDTRRLYVWGWIVELLLVVVGGGKGAMLGGSIGRDLHEAMWLDSAFGWPRFDLLQSIFFGGVAGAIVATSATVWVCQWWVTPILKRTELFSCERRAFGPGIVR
jgi:hypothetical protein